MASVLTILFTILICFGAGGIEAQTGRIADDEMNALHEIAEQVGKKDWDFNQTNCDENGNWGKTTFVKPTYNNTVNCTCSSGVCHITAMYVPSPSSPTIFVYIYGRYINFEGVFFMFT
ncbi:hypothetical protein CsSME_00031669 [Camellia sinensis var. sinensis]